MSRNVRNTGEVNEFAKFLKISKKVENVKKRTIFIESLYCRARLNDMK